MNTPLSIHSTIPVISTRDIKRSILYYINVLGFSPDFEYGDPLVYAGVKSGDAEIYFTYNPEMAESISKGNFHPEIFIWVTDIYKLFNKHTDSGAEIIEPVSDRPWGSRQYVIKDINGYHLKFAQTL